MKIINLNRILSLLILSVFVNTNIYTQNVAITDDDGYSAESTAMLDIKSTSKGLLVPRLDSLQRVGITLPATGLLVFDTDASAFFYYDGSDWLNLTTNVISPASATVNDLLFSVINTDGDTVFAVYPEGVRINVGDGAGKANKGGFAVGGLASGKAGQDQYLHVTPDSVRIYIDDDIVKANKGGFAVGGLASGKTGNTEYMKISSNNQADTINPSEARFLWYPAKEAFLVGRVLIESVDSVGTNSISTGYESKAIGGWSQALGYQSIARGNYSTAIGKNSVAHGLNSYAFGNQANALSNDAIAIGSGAYANNPYSFAFGSTGIDTLGNPTNNTIADGDYAFAFGLGAYSGGQGSFSLGANSSATGDFSTAIGLYANASGNNSTAVGYKAEASGSGSSAIGYLNESLGSGSFAAGINSTADGYGGIAIGSNCSTNANKAIAMGDGSVSSGYASIAMGKDAEATAKGAVSIGYYSVANAEQSYAFGEYCSTNGKDGAYVMNTVLGKTGLKASLPYQMNFKAENGLRFFAGNDTSDITAVVIAPTTGTVGIGYKSPNTSYKLDVDGDVNLSSGSYYKINGTSIVSSQWTTSGSDIYYNSGNVGIGNQTPLHTLSVLGNVATADGTDGVFIDIYNGNSTASVMNGIRFNNNATTGSYPGAFKGGIFFRDNGSFGVGDIVFAINTVGDYSAVTYSDMKMIIESNGSVGISTSNPAYRFQVGETSNYGYVDANGAWQSSSDIRYKENIRTISSSLNKVLAIRGVEYNVIGDDPDKRKQIGFIAQELEKILPEVVSTDSEGFKGVAYAKLTPLLLEAIKEQQQQIDDLKREIESLKR